MITLNVGGKFFITSVSTLTADQDSLFSKMFNANYDENVPYFIDRDPELFHIILNSLRRYDVSLEIARLDEAQLLKLQNDVAYYRVQLKDTRLRAQEARQPPRQYPQKIILNVGGKTFPTSISTLTVDDDSLFAGMFDNGYSEPDNNGHYYIDRDPQLFHIILNFLRGYDVRPTIETLSEAELYLLQSDVDYYYVKSMFHLFPCLLRKQVTRFDKINCLDRGAESVSMLS